MIADANGTPGRLAAAFGEGAAWSGGDAASTVWLTEGFDLLWRPGGTDAELRRVWEARKGLGARPVILLAPAEDAERVRVLGPVEARPVRTLPAARVLTLLDRASSLHFNQAASLLAGEFIRIGESALPGLGVKELLTPHFARERLREPARRARLEGAIEGVSDAAAAHWRDLFRALGYRDEQLRERGYLMRDASGAPVVVVHPSTDPDAFGRLNQQGAPPDGFLLADCERHGAGWGVLAARGRYRLFQRRPASGAAGGQWIEIDAGELEADNRFCLGLLAPDSLREGGWLAAWAREARDFGERLREDLQERLISEALPRVARGLGEHLESRGIDPGEPERLREVAEATLTLVFRFMFLLHVEARGYLPVTAESYRPRSATVLARDCRDAAGGSPSASSTQFWDRLRTLVGMIRTGDDDAGVPPYNGQLFAAEGFPGSKLLEDATVTNAHLAPALAAIAYDAGKADEPGLDYAGLDIGHLGAIYEALLALRLTRAPEDLVLDKQGIYQRAAGGEDAELAVRRRDLYWQSEAGGRKAGGVFYTREEFVRHLLKHSLEPALDAHLGRVRATLADDPAEAGRMLFDFSVLDPAMGSAHFLTAALDVMVDRYARFLADEAGMPGVRKQLDELRREDLSGVRPPEDGDLLRRLILKRCIYGVDVSQMAVEVANVTLWLKSFVPGLALSWLGGNLKWGDALIGVADPSIVGEARQRRRGRGKTAPRTAATLLAGAPVRKAMEDAARIQHEIASIPDRTPDEVADSEARAGDLARMTEGLRSVFDLWTAEPLGVEGARDVLQDAAPDVLAGKHDLSRAIADPLAAAREAAEAHRFLHWPLEFPGVFHRERPGFDVVVGNPPWDEVTIEELAFYALRDPGLRSVPTVSGREARITELDGQHPDWRGEFEALRERLATARGFFSRDGGGYELQGVGDTDLYQLFSERYTRLVREDGRLGVVLPRSAFVAKGATKFRDWLLDRNQLRRLDVYLLNNRRWAFSIHPQYTIALLAMQRTKPAGDTVFRMTGPSASLRAFGEAAGGEGVGVAAERLGSASIVPLLPAQDHADLLAKLRRGVEFSELQSPEFKIFRRGASAGSHAVPHRELDATQQKHLFRHHLGDGRLPVWKGESFDQYDPHGKRVAGYCDWDETLGYAQGRRMRSRVFKSLCSPDVLVRPLDAPDPARPRRVPRRDQPDELADGHRLSDPAPNAAHEHCPVPSSNGMEPARRGGHAGRDEQPVLRLAGAPVHRTACQLLPPQHADLPAVGGHRLAAHRGTGGAAVVRRRAVRGLRGRGGRGARAAGRRRAGREAGGDRCSRRAGLRPHRR